MRALLDADTDVADVLGEPPQLVRVVTRDERVAANARALGYAVV